MARRFVLFVLRWLQRAMFLAGATCIAWVFVSWKEATFFQLYARTELQHLIDDTKGPQSDLPRLPAALRRIESVVCRRYVDSS